MSVQQAAAQALATVQRAQALFGAATPPPDGGTYLGAAVTPLAKTGQRADALSGQLIDTHRSFVNAAVTTLTGSHDSDSALTQALAAAARVTQQGRRQLDDIVSRTRTLAAAAVTTRSAASQRTLLQALQTEVDNVDSVVTGTHQQATALATRIHSLNYRPPRTRRSDNQVQAVTYTTGPMPEAPPQGPVAPLPDPSANRWAGPPPAGEPENSGFWAVDITRPAPTADPLPAPVPYRSGPPPCAILEGPSSGVLTVGGKNPQSDTAFGFDLQNAYKFRISGTQFSGLTRMVQIDGKWYQAQWQAYTYEMNKLPVVAGAGQIPAVQVPIMSQAHQWTPVTLGQIMQENSKYPGGTFYLPNPFGEPLRAVGGELQLKNPVVPVMTAPH